MTCLAEQIFQILPSDSEGDLLTEGNAESISKLRHAQELPTLNFDNVRFQRESFH